MVSRKMIALIAVIASSVVLSCAGTKTPDMGSTLWGSLGGRNAVSSLSHAFNKELMKNSSLSSQLGKMGAEQVSRGLYNSLGEQAGFKIDKGTDLMSVLKKQKLDANSLNAVGASLKSAAKSEGLRSDQMTMLTGMWEPIAKKLM